MTQSPGEALSRFRDDVEDVQEYMILPVSAVSRLLFTVGAMLIMLQINVGITLAVVIPILLVSAAVEAMGRRIKVYREASREATAQVTGFLAELMGAVQAVKVANAETYVVRRFEQLSAARAQTAVKDRTLNAMLDTTFLVVSHRREALWRADKVVLLVNGRVAATGTLAELLSINEEMQRLWQGDVAGHEGRRGPVSRLCCEKMRP